MGILLTLKKHRDYEKNRKAIHIAPISTRNLAAMVRIWAVLWILSNMAMVQTAFTPMLHLRKWPLTE